MTPRIKMIVNFKLTLGQVTDNQCVIKIRRSRSKRRSFVSANSLQSKFKVYYLNSGDLKKEFIGRPVYTNTN